MTDCVHDHAAFPARWGPEDRLGAGNLLTATDAVHATR